MSEESIDIDKMCAVEYKMPKGLNLDNIDNCYPQWQRFKQSFKIFMMAAGYEKLSETRKAAILLNCVGQQTQELYFNVLKMEEKPKLEDVIKVLDNYFEPKQNELINSFNFNKRCQEDGESFDNFYSALRKMSENCNFGEQKERMLRDRIVIGVNDHRLQQKLLEIKDLTLVKAVDICRSAELSREHMKVLTSPEVHAVQAEKPTQQLLNKAKYSSKINNKERSFNNNVKNSKVNFNNNNKNNFSNNIYKCKKCHKFHGPRQCPAYGKQCNNCNKFNHFSVGCKLNKVNKKVYKIDKKCPQNENNNL